MRGWPSLSWFTSREARYSARVVQGLAILAVLCGILVASGTSTPAGARFVGPHLTLPTVVDVAAPQPSVAAGAATERPEGAAPPAAPSPQVGRKPYVASCNRESFHLRSCEWAGRVRSANLQEFATMAEAIEARHRPCKRCLRVVASTDSRPEEDREQEWDLYRHQQERDRYEEQLQEEEWESDPYGPDPPGMGWDPW